MKYSIRRDGDWVVISLTGAINFESVETLRSVFDKVLLEGGKMVRLDLKKVPVSNSAGIGSILMFYKNLKKRDGLLEIKGISKNLAEMFRLIKLDTVIQVEED
jgi:anti-sigma B factor antagonist